MVSFRSREDCAMPSTFVVTTRAFSSTPLPMAFVDLEIVSLVDFVTPDAVSLIRFRAPPMVELIASLVTFVTPAAVSDNRRVLSCLAFDAVSDTRRTAWSLALSAACCVLARVLDAACCAVSVAFLAVSFIVDEAFTATFLAVSSAAALEDFMTFAALFLNLSRNDDDNDDDDVEGRLCLSSGERRKYRVVE